MDTREELHAVLDELDSKKLPRPEVLRLALMQARGDVAAVKTRLVAELAARAAQEVSQLAITASEAGLDPSVSAAFIDSYVHSVSQVLSDFSSGQPSLAEQGPAEQATEEEQGPRRPRKLPRSMGMGKNGPPDLSEREGFGTPEAGTPH